MKRKPLSKKEIKALNEQIKNLGIEFNKKDKIDLIDDTYYLFENEIILFTKDDKIIPSLKFILTKNISSLPEVIVDMGAIKFIANGADVMRPGILEFNDNFEKGDFVIIKDIQNKKPIVIGEAIYSRDETKAEKGGKSFINIHHIGDNIWNLEF